MRILWTALVSPARTRASSSCNRATFSARWARTTSAAVPYRSTVIAPSSGTGPLVWDAATGHRSGAGSWVARARPTGALLVLLLIDVVHQLEGNALLVGTGRG